MPICEPTQNAAIKNNLNILYILPVPRFFSQIGQIGGHVSHAYGVVGALAEKGYDVDIIAEGLDPVLKKDCRRYLILPSAGRSPIKRIFWNQKLLSLIKKAVTDGNYDFVYCRYSVGFAPWVIRLRSQLGQIPLVLEVNSIGSSKRIWLRPLESRAIACADLAVCISEVLKEHLETLLGSRTYRNIYFMPNAVRPESFAVANKPDDTFTVGPIKIGYAGVFKPNYNLDVLASAMEMVRRKGLEVELHLAGTGPLRPTLQRTLFKLDWVVDHGKLNFEQVPNFLASMDILVCPQSHSNRFQSPLKIFEYMATQRPIIGANIPGIATLLGDSECGLLYRPDDASDLAQKIIWMASRPDKAQKMALLARKEILAHHTWRARLDSLLSEMHLRGLLP